MSIVKDFRAISTHCGSKFRALTKIMFYVSVIFRISHSLYSIRLVPLARVFWFINRVLFSVDIDPRATIKGGLVILHGTGIVIGKSVRILGDVKIYQGATLGGNNGKKKKLGDCEFSQPILKDNVTIGINAAILGPLIIENGVSVGANAVITKDIPANAVAVSNNKILSQNNG